MTKRRQVLLLVLAGVLVVSILALMISLRFHPSRPKGRGVPVEARDTADFLKKKGEALLQERQVGSLIAVYEGMLASYPDNPDLEEKLADAYYQLGVSALARGDAEKARRALDRALQLKSNFQEAEKLRSTL